MRKQKSVCADTCERAWLEPPFSVRKSQAVAHFVAVGDGDRSVRSSRSPRAERYGGRATALQAVRQFCSDGTEYDKLAFRLKHMQIHETLDSLLASDPQFRASTPCGSNGPYSATMAGSCRSRERGLLRCCLPGLGQRRGCVKANRTVVRRGEPGQ